MPFSLFPSSDFDDNKLMSLHFESDQSESRATLTALLLERLRYRWLGDPDSVSDSIADVFGANHIGRERLVSQLVVGHRTGQLNHQNTIERLISKNKEVRLLAKSDHWRSLDSETKKSLIEAAESSQSRQWAMPAIDNLDQLAQWLSLPSAKTLDWLTLPHLRRQTEVSHYRCRRIAKRSGGFRHLEEPRPTLKRVQRTVASSLLSNIPLHDAVHGFRAGHGIQSCATPHVGHEVVLRIDLQNFFGSITTGRVMTLFRVAGYEHSVALMLARLCTSPASTDIDADPALLRSRLPQGSPTSPTLANAVAFRMDRRISGLAKSLKVTYTRYADDLIFSGDDRFGKRTERFVTSASAIAMEEGFQINFRKTRIMRRGGRQSVLGLTVNEKLSTSRKEYDNLRATLHNCLRHGPDSQNREHFPDFKAVLRGKIAHIASVHQVRGRRLLDLFERIEWEPKRFFLSEKSSVLEHWLH